MSWKPEGYTSVSPYLIVGDAGRALAFIETVFDGTRLRVMPREDGGTCLLYTSPSPRDRG